MKEIMATIRKRLGKIHMFTYGRDFGIPKYLAEEYMCISGNGETEKAVRNVEADHFGC